MKITEVEKEYLIQACRYSDKAHKELSDIPGGGNAYLYVNEAEYFLHKLFYLITEEDIGSYLGESGIFENAKK